MRARSLISRLHRAYHGLIHTMTLGVRGIVLDDHDRLCLVRHTYIGGWHLPGGGVEVGETVEEALRRELLEEAGVELTGWPVLHGVFHNANASPRDHVIVYVVRSFSIGHRTGVSPEIAGAGFFALGALPIDTAPSTQRRIREVTKGDQVAKTW